VRTGSWLAVLIVLRRLLIGPTYSGKICRSTPFVLCVIFLALVSQT